ncbi:hypothetical protein [Chryseobacterium sp. 18068]|uniref:hypothetical protein n=1 Tax=Chryseobacterium sp. 18068 TaxID=2681414 RepID=UPI0013575F02|nr:hypothetical protein [Chryseobacterium sp. 18068]
MKKQLYTIATLLFIQFILLAIIILSSSAFVIKAEPYGSVNFKENFKEKTY